MTIHHDPPLFEPEKPSPWRFRCVGLLALASAVIGAALAVDWLLRVLS